MAGRPLASWVLDALLTCDLFGEIRIISQNSARLEAELGPLLPEGAPVTFHDSADRVADTITALVADAKAPLLVTTSDQVLITPEILRSFIAAARGADVATGIVERHVVEAAFPGYEPTRLPFRRGAYAGANLFWIGSRRALPLIALWNSPEPNGVHYWRAALALGPLTLIGAALGLFSPDRVCARIGRGFGIQIRPVILDVPEACIAIDTVADLRLAELLLLDRHSFERAPIPRAAE